MDRGKVIPIIDVVRAYMAQIGTVEIDPLIILYDLEHDAEMVVIHQTNHLPVMGRGLIQFQRNRCTRCFGTMPHIGNPLFPFNGYQFNLMTSASGFACYMNPTQKRTNIETEVFQSHQEQAVLFETIATDFFDGPNFSRQDERTDSEFYKQPRMVQHTDDRARDEIRRLHGRLFQDGDVVLDLMASWTSHLPESFAAGAMTGLGMNVAELASNSRLDRYVVHDLNLQPRLPFEDGEFDGVFCSVSVEYLVHPLEVFCEVARVLRPGGRFVVTFSNRWFPTKAIRIWPELHEFERMGLVLEYFRRSGKFHNLETYSLRGLPRPKSDKYYPDLLLSDPVYAVWGERGID